MSWETPGLNQSALDGWQRGRLQDNRPYVTMTTIDPTLEVWDANASTVLNDVHTRQTMADLEAGGDYVVFWPVASNRGYYINGADLGAFMFMHHGLKDDYTIYDLNNPNDIELLKLDMED